jgi:hypothetical protein
MIVVMARMSMDVIWKENAKMSMLQETEEDANTDVIIYQKVDTFAYVIEDMLWIQPIRKNVSMLTNVYSRIKTIARKYAQTSMVHTRALAVMVLS